MRRACGIGACVGTHLLFAFTVWHLFWFLKERSTAETGGFVWVDLALALQFAVAHSLLLHPAVRQKLTEVIPSPFYGLFFCTASCLGLLTTIFFWRPGPEAWWSFEGPGRFVMNAFFFSSWGLMLYSIRINGFGYQTGWTPWSYWFQRRAVPPRAFQPRSVYLWLRHPVYLSFLGLIWFTPVMTADRAILIAVWTAYVFVGSCLKDQRMLYFLGDRYREYQARVPGYVGMPLGPLARVPFEPAPSLPANSLKRAA